MGEGNSSLFKLRARPPSRGRYLKKCKNRVGSFEKPLSQKR
jgi:hypothetical protein